MKTVFTSNSEIAHLWAHQSQTGAKNPQGNFYFEEPSIYSYGRHFPIAKHVTNKQGEKTILFTLRGYSNTTSKHINHVRGAIPDYMNVIYCYQVPDQYESDHKYHDKNIEHWVKEIEGLTIKLSRAKKPEIYFNKISQEIDQAMKYVEFFSIKLDKKTKALFSSTNEKLTEIGKAKADEITKAEKKRKETEKKNLEIAVKSFKSFETNHIYDGNNAYLRYNADKNRVETSKGIEIPTAMANRFYNWIKTTIQAGGCDGGECTMKILGYSVQYVNGKEFKVGCHTVAITEAEQIAKSLNW